MGSVACGLANFESWDNDWLLWVARGDSGDWASQCLPQAVFLHYLYRKRRQSKPTHIHLSPGPLQGLYCEWGDMELRKKKNLVGNHCSFKKFINKINNDF